MKKDLPKEHMEREVDTLRSVKHKDILCFYDMVETRECVYLMMEYLNGGELLGKRLDEKTAKMYLAQVFEAIRYLHDNKITHRDLKLGNIMLSNEGMETNVKTVDFGLAQSTPQAQ